MNRPSFVDLCKGTFYLTASVSLAVVAMMFIYVWQPIWAEGFRDFHTISKAISQLDETAKPVSESVPVLLEQITSMNEAVIRIGNNVEEMQQSVATFEDLSPNVQRMNQSMDRISWIMHNQLGRMSYEVGQMENRLSPFSMFMPMNW